METNDPYKEIMDHLIKEMENNGFGDVVREVLTRIDEDSEKIFEGIDIHNKRDAYSSKILLNMFLDECIDVLNNLSNDNFSGLLEKLNKYTKSQGEGIESIFIELVNEEQPYDLKKLPSYKDLTFKLKEIHRQILEPR